jgi:site-specific DNA recombinase
MKAAVYCRKSTLENGAGATDETKSNTRQLEHAKAFATERGWTVSDDHVFAESDAVSGAEFARRPGLVKLLTALGRRAPFDVLIVSELSRLGREQLETGYVMKQLATAGVAVWSYLERKEILMSSPTDKFLMSAMSFAAEVEREKARERSRDAARQRAARGAVAGGACFGYANVRDASGFVAREIVPAEAEVVRQIFRLCAEGKGARRICATLNAEHAPTPRAQQRRPRGWMPSSVRAVLYRALYRGEVVWGKAQKRDGWGKVKFLKQPETTWLRTSAGHLRIVTDAEWDAAHERMGTSRLNYLRTTDGKLWGKPANGVESKYLLTGMAVCGECGGGMLVYSRAHGTGKKRQRVFFYGCPRARVDVCRNDLEVPMTTADAAAVEMMTTDVLSADVIERAMTKLVALLDGPEEDVAEKRERLTAAATKAEREATHLTDAIAAGGASESLVAALRAREREHKAATVELTALAAGPAVRAAAPEIRREALALLDDWRGLLGKHVTTTRQLLRKLLDRDSRFVFYPVTDLGERWYELGVTPSLDRFLGAVPSLKKAVASPTGFEPVFWP